MFEAAARLESFSRAGELLDISTSAVSQQLKALEAHLGTALFERGPRNVKLTDAGHAFLPAVRQALMTVEETASSLFGQEREHTLTLQCMLVFATGWLAPRLPDFSRRFPEIQLHFSCLYRDAEYQRPGSELQILFGPVHRSWAQCDRLLDETVYPLARADIASRVRSPADLLEHRLIQVSSHRINWHRVLQSLDLGPVPARRFCFVDTAEVALFMAGAGYGIALARAPTTDHLAQSLDLVPCLDGVGLAGGEAYYLVYQNVETLSPAARSFRDWLLQAVP